MNVREKRKMDAGACAERGSRVKRDGTANFWNLGQEMSHSDIALSQEEICISNDWISYEKKRNPLKFQMFLKSN